MPVDCAALPDALLESELFGHERGAFTGADRAKPGMIEVAHRGTLFLDEIGELPLALQPKLLRALQERQVRRVGSTKFLGVDIRLVVATNRQIAAQVQKGDYLADLLRRHGGNISQAAKTAHVDRKTLHRLLAKHGIKA